MDGCVSEVSTETGSCHYRNMFESNGYVEDGPDEGWIVLTAEHRIIFSLPAGYLCC